jgi:hypothetical protein
MCIINACASHASLIRVAPDSGLSLMGSKAIDGILFPLLSGGVTAGMIKLNDLDRICSSRGFAPGGFSLFSAPCRAAAIHSEVSTGQNAILRNAVPGVG